MLTNSEDKEFLQPLCDRVFHDLFPIPRSLSCQVAHGGNPQDRTWRCSIAQRYKFCIGVIQTVIS